MEAGVGATGTGSAATRPGASEGWWPETRVSARATSPKKLGLALAAALTIAQAGLSGGQSAVALVGHLSRQ
jgi:hypothetical protein